MVFKCRGFRLFPAITGFETIIVQTVVLPSGEVIQTRRRARKSSAGFDTTKLFIGAEGTLGIVTEGALVRSVGKYCHQQLFEATLRLAPIVPNKVAMAQFPDVGRAVDAVQEILRTPYGANIRLCLFSRRRFH
jgi:D-lactate dehydrogenase (cytochrome)